MWRSGACRPSDRIAVDYPEPASVGLAAGDFGGYVTVGKARRGQGQVAADEGRSLLAERELSPCGDDLA